MEEMPRAIRPRRRPAAGGSPGRARGSRRSPRPPCSAAGSRRVGRADDLAPPRGRRSAVTIGSLTTASVPRRTSTCDRRAAGLREPAAICRIRSSTRVGGGLAEGPDRPRAATCSGMTLALVPPWMRAERDHDRVARIDRAGDELVDAVDELRRHADRVDRLVRPGGVPAHALDLDLELLAEGGQDPLAMGDPARGQCRGRRGARRRPGRRRSRRPRSSRTPPRRPPRPAGRSPARRSSRGKASRQFQSASAAPSAIAAWASCPQACITPSRLER